jgi:DNA (cytosine-5)-methyltransferase 1
LLAWTTPCADDTGLRKKKYNQGGTPLLMQASREWPTPQVDSFRSRSGKRKHEMGLGQMARLEWPTPTAQDAKNNAGPAQLEGHATPLNVAAHWPTPTVQDARNKSKPSQCERNSPPLNIIARLGQGEHDGQPGPVSLNAPGRLEGSLNPDWVAQLMGVPEGWLDVEPLP